MAKDDGDFAKYNDYQKSILCMYPNGVLFRINEEDCYEKIPVEELDSNLANYLLYNLDDYNLDNLLKIVDERTFKDVIFEMHFNSINKKSIK